ncbi:MAG: flagellar assembly peptidoglycan hydrolase FlgJ, partial [Burkholderiaceae bacterium]
PAAGDGKARQRDFVNRVVAPAQAAAQATGIPAQFIVAQAALESGWGRHEIRDPGTGQPTHNLFGIKAGAGWSGRTVAVTTTEYVNGRAEKRVEKFRAYASDVEAFQDYARLLVNNPRYAHVVGRDRSAGEFAHGLQQAGYATDPQYGAKLAAVIRSTQALRSDA